MVTLNADGSLTYDPNGQFESLSGFGVGNDSLDYTIEDGQGASDSATVNISIQGINDAPIVNDAFLSVDCLRSTTAGTSRPPRYWTTKQLPSTS